MRGAVGVGALPFRAIAYAEDHLLTQDMHPGGLAKLFVPNAAVVHSHEYTPLQWLRRSFDEARAISDVYGGQSRPPRAFSSGSCEGGSELTGGGSALRATRTTFVTA